MSPSKSGIACVVKGIIRIAAPARPSIGPIPVPIIITIMNSDAPWAHPELEILGDGR
ncbi:hypothetical protein FHT77_005720 [Rhizobium sp. BK181]|nr:hypothetical protein [Rhizobium sp. BK181]